MDGREALAVLKNDPASRTIPVVVLTTSAAPDGVAARYQLHANAYACEPQELGAFLVVVQSIDDFYRGRVQIPEY